MFGGDEATDDGVVAVVSVGQRGGVGIKPFDIIAGEPSEEGDISGTGVPDNGETSTVVAAATEEEVTGIKCSRNDVGNEGLEFVLVGDSRDSLANVGLI